MLNLLWQPMFLVADDFSGNGTNKFVKINEIPDDGFEGVDAGEKNQEKLLQTF